MNPGVEMAVVQNNLRLLNNFISFIHTKRYVPNLQEDKKFNDLKTEDYDCIFEFLQEKEELGSRINVTSFDRGPELDIINFNLDGGDYNSNFNLKIVSLFRPNEECSFNMDLYENVNFFVGKKSDVWIKDLYLLITYFSGYSNIIKDCVKIN
jgi:hypothetical protein